MLVGIELVVKPLDGGIYQVPFLSLGIETSVFAAPIEQFS